MITAEPNFKEQVRNNCLNYACQMLSSETVPTAATAETVKMLVDTAVFIDKVNLRSSKLTESGMAGCKGHAFQ